MNGMKMKNILVFVLLLAFAALFGCTDKSTGQNNTNPSAVQLPGLNSSQNTPITLTPYVFSDFKSEFNYPNTMQWKKNTANYKEGKGYAGAFFSGANSGIIFAYFYVENITEIAMNESDYYDLAAGDLDGASTSQKDPLGMLQYATKLGNISVGKVEHGYAAARNFYAVKDNSSIYGVAMDIYVPQNTVLYSIRIYAANPNMASAIAQMFVSSIKFEVLQNNPAANSPSNISGNISVNASNNSSANVSANISAKPAPSIDFG